MVVIMCFSLIFQGRGCSNFSRGEIKIGCPQRSQNRNSFFIHFTDLPFVYGIQCNLQFLLVDNLRNLDSISCHMESLAVPSLRSKYLCTLSLRLLIHHQFQAQEPLSPVNLSLLPIGFLTHQHQSISTSVSPFISAPQLGQYVQHPV